LQIEKPSDEPASLIIYNISPTGSSQGLKISLLEQALNRGWQLAQFRVGGRAGGEWSLFLYRGDRPSRRALAAHLEVAPESLALRILADEPLAAAEDSVPATGDALLDHALTLCAAESMALPLAPKLLAALPGSPFRSAKQAENWKAGVAVREILKRGPPEGWSAVAYRLKAHRGRKPAEAWIPQELDPQVAIAAALGRPLTDIIVLKQAEPMSKPSWRKPHIVEEPFLTDPVEFIVTFGVTRRAWPPHVAPRTMPLSFLDLLRPEEGEGVLLTEENCGEPKPSAARPASSSHVWIH
jgi:hypothetical protein